MPPGKQAKEVKIEFKMEVNKMVSAMKDVQKSFQESTQNIDKMSDSFKNMESKLHLVNMKMADMTKNISAMTQTNMVMSKDIKQSFSEWGTLLNDNNQKITSVITKMIQLNKQNQAQREELAKQKALSKDTDRGIDATFLRLKMLNMGFNFIRKNIIDAISDINKLESRVKTISTITGEGTQFIESNIKRLSIQTGIAMDKIGDALQDAANEGNSLTQSMQKINSAVLIAQKSGISFENAIARVDDISDQFGKKADYVAATMLHLNLSSERAMKVFGRLSRDVQEANISFEEAASMMSLLANQAGVSESSLQISMRAMLNGIQRLGKEGSAEFMNNILPNWTKLTAAQQRQIEQALGLDKNSMIIHRIGEGYALAHENALKVEKDQDRIIAQSQKNPETMVKKMNEAWIHFISILEHAKDALAAIGPEFSFMDKFVSALKNVAQHIKDIRNTNVQENIVAMEKQIESHEAVTKSLEKQRDATKDLNEQARLSSMIMDNDKLISKLIDRKNAMVGSISEGDASSGNKSSSLASGAAVAKSGAGWKFNELAIMSEKQSTKLANEAFEKKMSYIDRQYTATYHNENKLHALIRKKADLEKLYNDVMIQTNKISQEHNSESEMYTKKWSTMMDRIQLDIGRTQNKIDDLSSSSSEKAEKHQKKTEADRQKDMYNYIQNQRVVIKHAYEHHEIGLQNHQLSVEELKLFADQLKNKNQQAKVQEQLNNDQKVAYQAFQEAEEKLKANFSNEDRRMKTKQMREDLETYELEFKLTKSRNMTRQEELQLLEKKVAYTKQNAKDLGVDISDQISHEQQIHNARVQYAQQMEQIRAREIQQLRERGSINDQQFASERANIQQTMDSQINAIQGIMNAELALKNKKEERRAQDQQIADAFANGMNTVMNTALEKAIKNTGDLSHAWSNFAKDFLLQIAQMIAKQMVFNALTGMGLTSGKGVVATALKKVFGFSSGTGVGGVPGYASGTGMMGTDTVPAMLSPGEIVLDRNASDVFRGMAANGGGMGGPTVIVVQSYPSLLGNKEELIRLDTALNNPSIRTSTDRRKV